MAKKWMSSDETVFVLREEQRPYDALFPGYYSTHMNHLGETIFTKIDDKSDDIISFTDSPVNQITSEIQTFWTKKSFFKQHGFPFKRGILLYGEPGCGKSFVIKSIVNELKNEGVAILVDMGSFNSAMNKLRSQNKNLPVIAIMEDLDSMLEDDEEDVLDMLDGFGGYEDIVFIATTNYLHKLPPRISNRPNRFDKKFQINHPGENTRREYFNYLASKSNIGQDKVEKLVSVSDGLSFAHLKELFVSAMCFEVDIAVAAENLRNMAESILEEEGLVEDD